MPDALPFATRHRTNHEIRLQPWRILLTILAGLISRQQQEVIEYLRTENRALKEAHGRRRIRLNDDQRRRLAAEKWNYSDRRQTVGRPRVRPEIVDLALRFAREDPS